MLLDANGAVLGEKAVSATLPDRHRLDCADVTMDYQPIVELESGVVRGFGAVPRWPGRCPRGQPDAIARWSLAQACVEARYWPGCRISVPIAGWPVEPRALLDAVDRALAAAGLAPAGLEIEFSERRRDRLATMLKLAPTLRERGVGLVLGGFGAGADDAVLLRQMRPTMVKLEAKLLGELPVSEAACRLVRSLVEAGRAAQVRVRADGVESLAQRLWLRRIGCDEAQGPIYSRPLPPDRLAALLDYGVDTCYRPQSQSETRDEVRTMPDRS